MAFPTGWQRKAQLTVKSGQITGSVDKLIARFNKDSLPEKLHDNVTYPGDACQADFEDVRFTSDAAGTSLLYAHFRNFQQGDSLSATDIDIAVRMPDSFEVGDSIYVWWKTASTESQPAPSAAGGWENVCADGLFFSTLDEEAAGGGDAFDFSPNGADGTYEGNLPDRVAGNISTYRQDADGNGDRVVWADLALAASAENIVVFSMWVQPNDAGIYMPLLGSVGDGNDGDFTVYISNDTSKFGIEVIGNNKVSQGTQTFTNGTEYHILMEYNATAKTVKFYVNGSSILDDTFSTAFALRLQEACRFLQNNFSDEANVKADEFFILNAARDADWVEAYYNAWSSPSSFWTVGATQEIGGTTGHPWFYFRRNG